MTVDAVMNTKREKVASREFQRYEPAIEAYLAEVRKQVRGLVPRQQCDQMLEETAYWIHRQARLLEAGGMEETDSIARALELHEQPKTVALNLIEDYFESEGRTPLTKRVGRANILTLTAFGLANMIYLMLAQACIYLPSNTPATLIANPNQIRRFWPEPLPFPEPSWQFVAIVGYPLIMPALIGWWIGAIIPARAASVVFWSLMPLIIAAFLVGTALLPNMVGLLYAIVLTLYWMPVGSLAAHFSSSRSRKKSQASC